MQIYMVQTTSGRYCVFSATAMNTYNYITEELALTEFNNDITFDPTGPSHVGYNLTTDGTKIYYSGDSTLFGTVLYEIPPPTDTQSYEFW